MSCQSDHIYRRFTWRVLRWTGCGALFLGMLLVVLWLPMTCTTSIIPPASPLEPVAVIIVDHGDTPSLVLPVGDSGMVRYAFGEWQWYALGNTGYLRAIPTLLLPTQGALGRTEMSGEIDEANVASQMRVGFQRMHRVEVERARVDRLHQQLELTFDSNRPTLIMNRANGLHFVHHPRRYTYFFNSNHMLAAWLEALGCEVRGPAFASRWKIESHRE